LSATSPERGVDEVALYAKRPLPLAKLVEGFSSFLSAAGYEGNPKFGVEPVEGVAEEVNRPAPAVAVLGALSD
jgi:hypothetical protein